MVFHDERLLIVLYKAIATVMQRVAEDICVPKPDEGETFVVRNADREGHCLITTCLDDTNVVRTKVFVAWGCAAFSLLNHFANEGLTIVWQDD